MPISKRITWAYGVTTVQKRLDDPLPRTLASLAAGGFDKPHLFIDGACDGVRPDLAVTTHQPSVKTAGNWILAAWELYLRSPFADRYVIFQDDILVYKELRQYLECCEYPTKGYCNLCTYPENLSRAGGHAGWYPSNQKGRGAQALMFNSGAIATLLSQPHLVSRMQNSRNRHRSVDGVVVDALRSPGYREYVHNPSLVDHVGHNSCLDHLPILDIKSFRGEQFDLLQLNPSPIRYED